MPSVPATLRRAIVRGAALLCCSVGVLCACGLSELSLPEDPHLDSDFDAASPPETRADAAGSVSEDAEPPPADASVTDAEDDASSVDAHDAAGSNDAGPACGTCTTPPTTCFTSPGTCNESACVYPQLAMGSSCPGNNQCDSAGSCGTCICPAKECYRPLCSAGFGSSCAYVPGPAGVKCGFLNLGKCDGQGKCAVDL